jgi:hypothetical protein
VFIELTGIDGTGIRAGFIKLATTETGPTRRETEIHRAGAMAAAATGAAIVLHSPHAAVTRLVLSTLEAEGFDPARLVWAHAHDSTLEENLELAARGMTISFDDVGVSEKRRERIAASPARGSAVGRRVHGHLVRSGPPEVASGHRHLLGTFLPAVERGWARTSSQLAGITSSDRPPSVTDGERHGAGEDDGDTTAGTSRSHDLGARLRRRGAGRRP